MNNLETPAVEVEIIAGAEEPLYVERRGQLRRRWLVRITAHWQRGKAVTHDYRVTEADGGLEFHKDDADEPYFVRTHNGRAVGCGCMDRNCRKAFKSACKHIVCASQLLEEDIPS